MLENKESLKQILSTLIELFISENRTDISNVLRFSELDWQQTNYDNWNGGIFFYTTYFTVPIEYFVKIQAHLSTVEIAIKEKIELLIRGYEQYRIENVVIIPKATQRIDWEKISNLFTKQELVSEINSLKAIMISVSTGGDKIQDVNSNYQDKYSNINKALSNLDIINPNNFSDLWLWYEKWKDGTLPQYSDRRIFVSQMYNELLNKFSKEGDSELVNISVNLSGWDRIDRSSKEIRTRLKESDNEEKFQTIGLLCRETIISLAQAVFNKDLHPTIDGIEASKTDAKRMLDAYISNKIPGKSNENLRKYARAALDLANELTHKRTATSKDAALCASASITLVNLIGIIEDRH